MSISPLMPVYPRCGVRPVKGEHCHLIDEDGTRYLDFASGIAVNLLGHSPAGLIGAIQRQAETLMHVSNLYGSPQGEELAQMLVDKTFADTVFFTNSGAEAVEAAIKTARAYHQHDGGDAKRTELITFTNAFHGRTMATISASNQEKMHKGFMPLLGGFQYAEFDNLDHAKSLMSEKTAGFLVEPIQGEGGIRPGSEEFIRGLRQLADENDLMLVFDEVQCGVARTGKLYAYEHYGIEPDIMATAKGIGGGFPLGACLATEKAARRSPSSCSSLSPRSSRSSVQSSSSSALPSAAAPTAPIRLARRLTFWITFEWAPMARATTAQPSSCSSQHERSRERRLGSEVSRSSSGLPWISRQYDRSSDVRLVFNAGSSRCTSLSDGLEW